ncbi:MAG: hypothetical protein ACOC0M_00610 [Halomonas sp.]
MHPIRTREEILQEVRHRLDIEGRSERLARLQGISRQAVDKWLRTGIPRDKVGIISGLTGLPDYVIRPDEFLPPVEGSQR